MIPFSYWKAASAEIIQDGLILYQDAADSASYPGSGTDWDDLVNGITGDLQNGPIWNSGGYFTFDGVNDQMEYLATNVSPFQFGTGNFTMNCWVYIPNANQCWNLFETKASSGFLKCTFGFGSTSGFGSAFGKKMFYILFDDDASDGRAVNSDDVTGLDNWVHLSFVRDGGRSVKMYANAVELGQTVNSNFGSANFDLSSGQNWYFSTDTGNTERFDDKVSIIYWYDRALSQAEVEENFNVHKSRFGL